MTLRAGLEAKKTALKVVENGFAENHLQSDKQSWSETMVLNAQYFLVKYYSQKLKVRASNELRLENCHSKAFSFELEKLPPISKTIFKRIQCTYCQCCWWLISGSNASVFLDPLSWLLFTWRWKVGIWYCPSVYHCHALVRNVQGILYIHLESNLLFAVNTANVSRFFVKIPEH